MLPYMPLYSHNQQPPPLLPQDLDLSTNHIATLSRLTSLQQLTALCLSSNRLGESTCLFGAPTEPPPPSSPTGPPPTPPPTPLPKLEVLQLGMNGINSLATLHLHMLMSLRTLFLQANEITHVDSLSSLPALRELILDRNRIRQLDPLSLSGLDNLRELRLEENGLRSLSHIHHVRGV